MADQDSGAETREVEDQQDDGGVTVPVVMESDQLPEWLRQGEDQPALLHVTEAGNRLLAGVQQLLELPSLEARRAEAEDQLEKAQAFEVASGEDAEKAADAIRALRSREKTNKAAVSAVIDPIRKKGLDPLYELRRQLTNPLSEAQDVLKKKIDAHQRRVERERRERERRRQQEAQEKAEKRREEEFEKAVDEGDEERAEAILEHADAPVAPEPDAEDEEDSGPPEGVHYRDNWKMRLAGETESDREESFRKLVQAVADPDHPAPLSLLQLDQKRANKLADASSGEISFPGLEAYNDRTPVVR